MMIPSNYAVNIALNGRHFCLCELGQGLEAQAVEKAQEIAKRFPAEQGFSVELTHVTCYGQSVDIGQPGFDEVEPGYPDSGTGAPNSGASATKTRAVGRSDLPKFLGDERFFDTGLGYKLRVELISEHVSFNRYAVAEVDGNDGRQSTDLGIMRTDRVITELDEAGVRIEA